MSAPINASNSGSIGPKSWGALQLPASSNSSGSSTPVLTPSKSGSSSQAQTKQSTTNGNAAQNQKKSSDPFADLDSMFG